MSEKRSAAGRSVAVTLIALAVLALVSEARQRSDIPMAEHGAASMEFQLGELDKLLPQVDYGAPAGFDPVVWDAFVPDDNTTTRERVELGRKLYFDKRLSHDGTVSCATCHDVTRAFTDQRNVSEGIRGQLGRRNAPTTMNVALLQTLFLDGRSPSLDHQARMPIINPIEMGFSDGDSAARAIANDPDYQRMFRGAYGRDVNYEDIGRAIGAFERTLVFIDSPFRRFLLGDSDAVSPEAQQGWALFNGKARAVSLDIP